MRTHTKCGIKIFEIDFSNELCFLVPGVKAANNGVSVCRLYYIDALKRELVDTKAYKL